MSLVLNAGRGQVSEYRDRRGIFAVDTFQVLGEEGFRSIGYTSSRRGICTVCFLMLGGDLEPLPPRLQVSLVRRRHGGLRLCRNWRLVGICRVKRRLLLLLRGSRVLRLCGGRHGCDSESGDDAMGGQLLLGVSARTSALEKLLATARCARRDSKTRARVGESEIQPKV